MSRRRPGRMKRLTNPQSLEQTQSRRTVPSSTLLFERRAACIHSMRYIQLQSVRGPAEVMRRGHRTTSSHVLIHCFNFRVKNRYNSARCLSLLPEEYLLVYNNNNYYYYKKILYHLLQLQEEEEVIFLCLFVSQMESRLCGQSSTQLKHEMPVHPHLQLVGSHPPPVSHEHVYVVYASCPALCHPATP